MIPTRSPEDFSASSSADIIEIEVSGSIDLANYFSEVPFSELPDNSDSNVIGSIEAVKITDDQRPIVREDVPLQPQVKQEIQDWVAQRREGARGGIAITLIIFFGVSLLAEFSLIGLGAFYPQANSALIKDTLPLLINSLTSILSLALAFYFKDK
jgi:hypothetical protein